jgi:hypothetical protein
VKAENVDFWFLIFKEPFLLTKSSNVLFETGGRLGTKRKKVTSFLFSFRKIFTFVYNLELVLIKAFVLQKETSCTVAIVRLYGS